MLRATPLARTALRARSSLAASTTSSTSPALLMSTPPRSSTAARYSTVRSVAPAGARFLTGARLAGVQQLQQQVREASSSSTGAYANLRPAPSAFLLPLASCDCFVGDSAGSRGVLEACRIEGKAAGEGEPRPARMPVVPCGPVSPARPGVPSAPTLLLSPSLSFPRTFPLL